MSAPGDRDAWASAYLSGIGGGLHAFLRSLRLWRQPVVERSQVEKPVHRVTKCEGPMLYIGQQIVKRMEKMGYPSKIHEHFRTPERQSQLKAKGHSKAGPWRSPHQFGEAVDIVHKTKYWQAGPDYWEALASCVRVIEADLRVSLVHGHHWKFVDSAHVELADWRNVRDAQILRTGGNYVPTSLELNERWRQVLPGIKCDPVSD